MEQLQSHLELTIEEQPLKKAALLFRAVNHKLRQQILGLLHLSQRMTVTEIYNKLKLEQSVASQHLAILRSAKLVKGERDGKNIFYSVNYKELEKLHRSAVDLIEH